MSNGKDNLYQSEFDDEDWESNGDYLDFEEIETKNAVVLTKYNKKGELEEVIEGIPQIKEYLKKIENGNKD